MISDSWIWRRSNGVYIRKTYSAITHSHTNILFLFLVFFFLVLLSLSLKTTKAQLTQTPPYQPKQLEQEEAAQNDAAESLLRSWPSRPAFCPNPNRSVTHFLLFPIRIPTFLSLFCFSQIFDFCWSRFFFFFFVSLESVWILWKCKLFRDAKENRLLDLRNDDFLFPFLTNQTVR